MTDWLIELLSLKTVDRAGWHRVDIAAPESVAGHSWGVATLALVLCPPELDRDRVVAIALVHDLAEVRTGDITPHDGIDRADKQRLETTAAKQLFASRPDLFALWEEYDTDDTEEARFVHDLDKLEMALQALAYRQSQAADTREFIASAAARARHPVVTTIIADIQARVG